MVYVCFPSKDGGTGGVGLHSAPLLLIYDSVLVPGNVVKMFRKILVIYYEFTNPISI